MHDLCKHGIILVGLPIWATSNMQQALCMRAVLLAVNSRTVPVTLEALKPCARSSRLEHCVVLTVQTFAVKRHAVVGSDHCSVRVSDEGTSASCPSAAYTQTSDAAMSTTDCFAACTAGSTALYSSTHTPLSRRHTKGAHQHPRQCSSRSAATR